MKKISLIASLSLFILAACATSAPDVSTVDTPDESGPRVGITYANDLDCDMLEGTEAQESCKIQVNDVIGALLENDVISHFDLQRCVALQDKIGTNCQTQLEATGVQGPVTDEERAIFNEAVNGLILASDSLPNAAASLEFDSAKCNELTTPGYKEYCHKEIARRTELSLFNDITLSGNPARCGELTTLQTQCEEFFEVPELPVSPVGGALEPVNPPIAPAAQ